MRRIIFASVLLALTLLLAGCRFAVVESGSVRIEAPTATPEPLPTQATEN